MGSYKCKYHPNHINKAPRGPSFKSINRVDRTRKIGLAYGLKLLQHEVEDDYHPLEWQCGDHIRSCSIYQLKQGYKCQHCGMFRSVEALRALGIEHGLIFNDTANHGALKPHKWLCEEAAHEVKASPNRVQQSLVVCRGCNPASNRILTRKILEDYAASIGYTYAGHDKPKSTIAEIYYCRQGHPFKATLKYLRRRRCSICNPKTPVCEDHKQRKLAISDRFRQVELLLYNAKKARHLQPAE